MKNTWATQNCTAISSSVTLIYIGCYLPVVVHVAEFVGESLHVIWFEAAVVKHHIVVSRWDATKAHSLTYYEEIVPESRCSV